MEQYVTLKQIDQATEFIRCRTSHQPRVGMVLGSGLGELADLVEDADIIPSVDIPFWPESTVLGHEGRLVIGGLGGQKVMILQGRTHYYEGYSSNQITLPIRVMQRLGMEMVILTNAAGAVHPDYKPGDLMILSPSRKGVKYASGTFYARPTVLHVSRGVSSELPLRLNCEPELARLVLRKEDRGQISEDRGQTADG